LQDEGPKSEDCRMKVAVVMIAGAAVVGAGEAA
jgi:hypothetical protein